MRILFISDIVGKGGRKAVGALLPQLKKEHKTDTVIANVENIAHGTGITKKTLDEIASYGVDIFTSGNHIWAKKEEAMTLLEDGRVPLLRPHNMPSGPGTGIKTFSVGAHQLVVMNLQGQVFMNEGTNNPFQVFDEMMKDPQINNAHAILVDFHAEATSEKVAFGWYAEEKVSAVVGTHTHIPTADVRILPKGTAYVTDVGMTGPQNSVIGVDTDVIISTFRTAQKKQHVIPETGTMVFQSVLIDIDTKTKKATKISRVDQTVDIA